MTYDPSGQVAADAAVAMKVHSVIVELRQFTEAIRRREPSTFSARNVAMVDEQHFNIAN